VTISLVPVNADNWWSALELSVHPEQLPFVANYAPIVAFALAKAYVHHNDMLYTPYLIVADGQQVGFVELARQRERDDLCWLYHLFIDQHHQGKGYGKQALDEFIRLAQENHGLCREIRLSVHPDNVAACALYVRRGFQPTGERFDNGERVYALSLPQRV
jgi:diamine N-acetyltransferase